MSSDRDAVLLTRHSISGAYHVLMFEHPDVARDARAGQFVMLKAGRCVAPPLRRPFSIMDVDPIRGAFRIFIKVVGSQTHALAALRPGETARCLGPLGRPFQPPAAQFSPLLIGGGFGIAPFLLWCAELQRADLEPQIFYGGRTASDLALLKTFKHLGAPLVIATEDGTLGAHGLITEALEQYLATSPRPATLFACGPGAMLAAVARIAAQRGLPAQVSLDPWMGCGMGTCLGCVVRTQKASEERPRYRCACTEGPVFDSAEIVWDGEVESRARAKEAKS